MNVEGKRVLVTGGSSGMATRRLAEVLTEFCSSAHPHKAELSQLVGMPIEIESFLRIAISIAAAISKMHQRGLVHKDIKPANVLVNCTDKQVRLRDSVSHRACRGSSKRPRRPSSSRVRWPIWPPNRPDG